MQILSALNLLGLCWKDRENKEAIRAAWKQKIHKAHPDKNDSQGATKLAQALNEAKEVLLGNPESELDKIQREAQEELQAKEEEIKREHEAFMRRCEEYHQKEKERKKERYNKNRKKRVSDSRAHKNIEQYAEGRILIEEMKSFFKDSFKSNNGSTDRLLVSDIMDHFTKSRDTTSILEKRLFQRHAKRILQGIWPNAKYSKFRNKMCFLFIAIRNK